MVDALNRRCAKHIITLEDPIEYLHSHQHGIISQREINVDTENYVTALRASLRQSPDVILLGEMRDYETIGVAMTAAETGHLIISTLHTIGAANTIDRIIDVFPANQQRQIAVQLSMVLQAIVSQQLVPDVNGNVIPAFEIMTVTPAIRNMIRENKVPQIDGVVYSSNREDMISMDSSLLKLYQEGKITKAVSYTHLDVYKRQDGYWYYSDIVPVSGNTEELLAQIAIPEEYKESFNVVVVQECTPVLYEEDGTPYADWNRIADTRTDIGTADAREAGEE